MLLYEENIIIQLTRHLIWCVFLAGCMLRLNFLNPKRIKQMSSTYIAVSLQIVAGPAQTYTDTLCTLTLV